MTTRSPRLFLIASALALSLVEASVFAAGAWNSPIADERAGVPARAVLAEPLRTLVMTERPRPASRGASPYGALLGDLQRNRLETARLEEAPRDAIEDRMTPQPPLASQAPLPPSRPIEFASLTVGDIGAPLPPARPRELAGAPPPPTAELGPAAAPPPQAPAAASAPALSLAALEPEPPSPLLRRDDGNFRLGAAAFVRIFKQEGELELWLKRGGRYSLYRAYPICKWSGHLGPKLQSGDYQSPEGFYSVSARQLNPNSAYHRAFNIGFPNAFDRQNGRTGGALMVHGACKSVGCFAMTDKVIEEIYGFVEAAIRGGQREVPVHIFPFRMTDAALVKETKGDWTSLWSAPANHQRWSSFWQNLKEGYDLFEHTGEPPTAYACGSRYAFGPAGGACPRIAGW